MAAKIIAAILTGVLNLAMAVFMFAMIIIAMNGFHGSDAQWGILLYLILALVITVSMSVAAAILANRLGKRSIHPVLVTLISSVVFIVIGAVLTVANSFAAVLTAEFVRKTF